MRALLLKLFATCVLVVLVEAAFRAGAWEPLAKPDSHAGTSVRLKHALLDRSQPRIDYVTLGSSRPRYGINHAMLAAAAQRHGAVHANLSMPGSHWMTVGILGEWMARHHPETRGALIALSIQDFAWPGNGSYELGIVQPFQRLGDVPWMEKHVPFRRADMETWGVYSALFGWRQDIRNFIAAPGARLDSLRWYALNRSSSDILFGNPEAKDDMCHVGLATLASCDQLDSSTDPAFARLKRQCTEVRAAVEHGPDFATLMRQSPLPDALAATQTMVREQLQQAPWPQPPLVVLMPVPRIWLQGAGPRGLHAWALDVLRPLVDSGRIRLIDATGFFNDDADGGCSAFFDFYHQNESGRDRFTQWLLPRITAAFGPENPAP